AGELQLLLQSKRGMVMQNAGKKIFFLEYELAAEKHRARKLFGYRLAELFELFDQINPEPAPVLGIPTETGGEIDKALEIFFDFPFEIFNFRVAFELAGIDDPDGNENNVAKMIG